MSYWAGKRVFVTGCTGFIGGWLTQRLVDSGAQVFGLIWEVDPDAHFYRAGLDKRVTCVPGDIRDLPLLKKTMADGHIDTVFHLAAQAIVTKATLSPLETYETNTMGTWALLEAARSVSSLQRIVVASTDKVYGDQKELPYLESSPICATNPYDVSKAAADLIARSYAETYHLPLAVVRCGNIYGGGDLNFDRLIPGAILAGLQNERLLVRSDGTLTRDYLYVGDAVDGYLMLGQALDQQRFHGEVFNFGNEEPFTVLEVIDKVLSLMGQQHLTPIVQNVARAEIQHQYISAAKAKDELGWVPAHDLGSGLPKAISWYEAFPSEKAQETASAA